MFVLHVQHSMPLDLGCKVSPDLGCKVFTPHFSVFLSCRLDRLVAAERGQGAVGVADAVAMAQGVTAKMGTDLRDLNR